MQKKRSAFTLIELLVVIGIIMLTLSFGFVSFFYYRERQTLETAALQLENFLRDAQNKAKNGNRGAAGSTCNPADHASVRLLSWGVGYASGNRQFSTWPICSTTTNPTEVFASATDTFTLPEGISFSTEPSTSGTFAKFASVLGTTQLLNGSGSKVDSLKMILTNGTDTYRFYVQAGGMITTGCFGTDNEEC